MAGVLDSARMHKRYSYPVATGEMAAQLTPPEFAQLAPAQCGFVNRARRQQGLLPFDAATGTVAVEVKAKPVKQQLEEAVELEHEVADNAPKKRGDVKPKKPKRRGLFGCSAASS
jgi:hypothetical protein